MAANSSYNWIPRDVLHYSSAPCDALSMVSGCVLVGNTGTIAAAGVTPHAITTGFDACIRQPTQQALLGATDPSLPAL